LHRFPGAFDGPAAALPTGRGDDMPAAVVVEDDVELVARGGRSSSIPSSMPSGGCPQRRSVTSSVLW
jgi:hypothetical protein